MWINIKYIINYIMKEFLVCPVCEHFAKKINDNQIYECDNCEYTFRIHPKQYQERTSKFYETLKEAKSIIRHCNDDNSSPDIYYLKRDCNNIGDINEFLKTYHREKNNN
jgi:transposase-like protein